MATFIGLKFNCLTVDFQKTLNENYLMKIIHILAQRRFTIIVL